MYKLNISYVSLSAQPVTRSHQSSVAYHSRVPYSRYACAY